MASTTVIIVLAMLGLFAVSVGGIMLYVQFNKENVRKRNTAWIATGAVLVSIGMALLGGAIMGGVSDGGDSSRPVYNNGNAAAPANPAGPVAR